MKINFSLLFSFIYALSFAQEKEFKAGFILGLTASQISGDTHGGFHKPGPAAGAFTNFNFNEKTSGQLEILYIQKGSRNNINPEKGDYNFYLLRLNYIEVPVLLKYKHKQFVFEAGPALGTLISFHEEDANGPVSFPLPFRRTELSGNIGVNYGFGERFYLNWRYSNSLLPVRGYSFGRFPYRYGGQYNSLMTISLRYQLKK